MSTEVESLASILSNVEAPKAEAEVKEQPRDETGKFAAEVKPEVKAEAEVKPEIKPEAKVETKSEIPRRDLAAIIDERKKRQEAETKLRELQAQKPKTDIFEDPDAAIAERLVGHLAPLKEALFEITFEAMRERHQDFDEVAEAFTQASEKDPELIKGMQAAKNPAKYVYTVGLQLKELADVGGDFAKYKEKITGELQGKVEERDKTIAALTAELETLKKSQVELAQVPRSLNKTQSGVAPQSADADPEDIKSIARFKSSRG